MPAQQVDAMRAAGPAPVHYNPRVRPLLKLLGELERRPAVRELIVKKPDFRLALRRSREPEHAR
jgi:oxaloacetate decarboxylase alpha subunit